MSSKRFIPARASFLAMLLVGVAAPFLLGIDRLWSFTSSNQTEWSRLIDERVRRSGGAITGRKVIFIGGSNMIFGVKPASLSARIGAPVVSYAVNAGIGIDLIIARAEPLIRSGDLVVLAPETDHFLHQNVLDYPMRGDWLRLFGNPSHEWIGRFPVRQWIAARERCRRLVVTPQHWWTNRLLAFRASWRGLPPFTGPSTAYDLRSIDADGYNTFPRPGSHRLWPVWPRLAAGDYDWSNSIGAVGTRRLAAVCAERGARLLIMPGVRGAPAATPSNAWIYKMATDREGEMLRFAQSCGARVLLPAGGTVVDDSLTYDSGYHLNDMGVAAMEDRLVPVLRSELAR